MQIERAYLGQFENVSGRFAISDPCYDVDTWCRGELDDVKKGTWNAEAGIYDAGDWGKRVALLIATHNDYDEDAEGDYLSDVTQFDVGVDSGQAGIFDATHYRDDSVIGYDEPSGGQYSEKGKRWYDLCCRATLYSEHQADVIPYGVVSSSGYGDGVYECTFWLDSTDEVIKVLITFIGEDDKDDAED
jgi:hypothetical protein